MEITVAVVEVGRYMHWISQVSLQHMLGERSISSIAPGRKTKLN